MGNQELKSICSCSENNNIFDNNNNNSEYKSTLENGKLDKPDLDFLAKNKIGLVRNTNTETIETSKTNSKIIFNLDTEETQKNTKIDLGENNFYEGGILNEKYHGSGKLVVNNKMYVGKFVNGLKEGVGELTDMLTNKIIYKGKYYHDKKQGLGKLFI